MFFVLINNYAYYARAGNIITLLALRLNASNLVVGVISSFIFISYLFLIPGRIRIRKVGNVKLFYRYYLMRNLLMLPILLTPFLAFRVLPVTLRHTHIVLFPVQCRTGNAPDQRQSPYGGIGRGQ